MDTIHSYSMHIRSRILLLCILLRVALQSTTHTYIIFIATTLVVCIICILCTTIYIYGKTLINISTLPFLYVPSITVHRTTSTTTRSNTSRGGVRQPFAPLPFSRPWPSASLRRRRHQRRHCRPVPPPASRPHLLSPAGGAL